MNYLVTSVFAIALMSTAAGFSPLALASQHDEDEKQHSDHHKETSADHGKENCKRHAGSAEWKAGLTPEQGKKIEPLKEDYHKKKHVLKDKIKEARLTLSKAMIQDTPKQDDIYKNINAVLKLKGEKMRLKAAHIIQVRKLLTTEQQVKFDKYVLNKRAYCQHDKGQH